MYLVDASPLIVLYRCFETLQVFCHGLKMCKCLGVVLPLFFLSIFPIFSIYFLPGLITIRIDTLWAQLLEFSTDHFETPHICSP